MRKVTHARARTHTRNGTKHSAAKCSTTTVAPFSEVISFSLTFNVQKTVAISPFPTFPTALFVLKMIHWMPIDDSNLTNESRHKAAHASMKPNQASSAPLLTVRTVARVGKLRKRNTVPVRLRMLRRALQLLRGWNPFTDWCWRWR